MTRGLNSHLPARFSLIFLLLCSLTVACTADQKNEEPKVKIPDLKTLESNMAKLNPQDFGKNIIFYDSFETGTFQFLGGGRPTDNSGPTWARAPMILYHARSPSIRDTVHRFRHLRKTFRKNLPFERRGEHLGIDASLRRIASS